MYRRYATVKGVNKNFQKPKQNNNKTFNTFENQTYNKKNQQFYKRGADGYFYQINTFVPKKIQSNGSKNRAPEHGFQNQPSQNKYFLNKPSNNYLHNYSNNYSKTYNKPKNTQFIAKSTVPEQRKAEFSYHYRNHFIKGSNGISSHTTCSFCNYCCKIGHISLECPMLKPYNTSKFMWVKKNKDIAECSTSYREVPKSN